MVPCTLLSTMTTPSMPPAGDDILGKTTLLHSLRDEQRSARRWQDLLTPQDRRAMLADIAHVALAIGQDLYPQQNLSDLDIGPAPTGGGDICPRERLAYWVTVWPRVAHALRMIEIMPASALIPGVREVRVEQGSLKRVSPSAVLAAVRSGDLISAPVSSGPLAQRLQGRLPRRIAEGVAVPTCNTPINRDVKAVLVQIVRDLGRIVILAEGADAPDVARQAEALREMVGRCLRRAPWNHLAPAPVRSVYPPSSHPAYRYLFDQWRRYRASFAFDWANPLFALPARETWLLYEYSALFTIARTLRDLGFRALSADGFALSRTGLTFALQKGQVSRFVFQGDRDHRVILRYNPNFPRKGSGLETGWHSRSHNMRPDITVEADGRLLVFDAKFKTYAEPSVDQTTWQFRDGALLPDLQQMHTYRDAIVCGDRENVVSEAWLLYPGRLHVTNPAVAAYPASSREQPFGVGKVGALLV
ncbi:MAG: nuclease domain-containing protein, partial [Armatimonadota bacterium]